MNKKYPTLCIHAGQSKTGSTAIQSFLHLNRKKLFDARILYPNFNVPGYTSGQSLNHGNFFKQLKDEPDKAIKEFDKLFEFCMKHEVDIVVISVEWFSFQWWAEMMGKIVNQFDCDHKVIIYLKRQDYWVESSWKQWGYKAYPSIQNYYNSTNLDWFIMLKNWLRYFQVENICLYPFEREVIGNDVVTHFMKIVGIENKKDYVETKEKSSSVNPGFSPLVIKILEQSKHLLKSKIDNQLQTYMADNLSDRFKKSSPFQSYGLLSPKERIHLLEKYEDSNQKIAHLFFGQQRESLFLEPWPDPEEPYQSISSVSMEEVIPLFMDLMFNQYQELQRVKNQIKLINLKLSKLSLDLGNVQEVTPKVSSWIPVDLFRIFKRQKYLHQIQLHSIEDQYCIFTSESDDPYFVIPFNVRPILRSAIRLKITVPLDTFVIIYFKNVIFQGFSENRTLRFQVRPGTHELIIKLPGKRFPVDIRIDPGDVPGKYIIHQLEIGT